LFNNPYTQNEQDDIDNLANRAKEAIRLGDTILISSLPRKALVQAAWQGVVHYHMERASWGDTLHVRQYELEKNARLEVLSDDEREEAVTFANHWLDDNFDQ